MDGTYVNVGKRKIPRWILAALSTAIIVALLGAYALLTEPGILKPREVTVTGTVTATGASLSAIIFTNTGCGTENVANISTTGDNSGFYEISLGNEYSYNVSLAWSNGEDTMNNTQIDVLILDTYEKSMVKDWILPP
jgi:hypothetical protein